MMPKIGKRTRTVLRMTIARSVNDCDFEGYAAQVKLAQPHYVEVKSMCLLRARALKEVGLESMLEWMKLRKIAKELAR